MKNDAWINNMFRVSAWTAIAAVILTIFWMTLMSRIPYFIGHPGILMYARVIAMDPLTWKLVFYFTFFNALIQIPIILGIFFMVRSQAPVRSLIGLVYGIMYMPISSITHFFQLTVVPYSSLDMLMGLNTERVKAAHLALSGGWNFINPNGPGYAVEVLASTFLGISLLLFGSAILRNSGLKGAIGVLMILGGVFQMLGFLGYLLGNQTLAFCTSGLDISWAVLYPLLAIAMFREAKINRIEQGV